MACGESGGEPSLVERVRARQGLGGNRARLADAICRGDVGGHLGNPADSRGGNRPPRGLATAYQAGRMNEELTVLANGRRMGVIFRDSIRSRLRFEYDAGWRTDAKAFPLSLSMPLSASEHGHEVIDWDWLRGRIVEMAAALPDAASEIARQMREGGLTHEVVSQLSELVAERSKTSLQGFCR